MSVQLPGRYRHVQQATCAPLRRGTNRRHLLLLPRAAPASVKSVVTMPGEVQGMQSALDSLKWNEAGLVAVTVQV